MKTVWMMICGGLLLLAGWVFFLHATWRSLGMLGVCFAVLFFAAALVIFFAVFF